MLMKATKFCEQKCYLLDYVQKAPGQYPKNRKRQSKSWL